MQQVKIFKLESGAEPWDWVAWEDQQVDIGFRFRFERAPAEFRCPKLIPLGLKKMGGKSIRHDVYADIPHHQVTSVLCLSGAAFSAIGPFLSKADQVFPLKSRLGEYYAINLLRVIDCLDLGRVEAQWFQQGVSASAIWKYAFRPRTIPRRAVFSVPQFEMATLVTEPVIQAIEERNLRGYGYRELESIEPFE